MTGTTGGERLPCGRDWDELLDQVSAGQPVLQDAHQQSCPHCQATLAELGRLWGPVRQLARQPVVAPPGMVAQVMHRVREVARQNWHSVITGERGSTRVAARVLATLARLAAARVPGVEVALGRTTETRAATRTAAASQHHETGGAVGVAGSSTVVDLAVAARYGVPLHELAERVRTEVVGELTRSAGLAHVQVNVTIDDVLD